jgi:hypothetical protein
MTPAEKAQRLVDVLRTNELHWRYEAMRERSELAGLEASHKQWESDRLNDEYGGPGPGDFRNPYSSLEPKLLKEILGLNNDITLYVGGLPINISDLAKRGWSCRIVHNLHGGRTRVAFTSADTRSVITFRMAGSYRRLSFFEIFKTISHDDMSGVITKNTKPIVYEHKLSELETLEQLHNNIQTRLQRYREAHPRKVSKTVVERAIAFVAA